MTDVTAHDKRGDLWIVVRGIAYDLSGLEAKHPGGILPPCVAWHAHVAELLAVRVQRRQQRGNGACRER
jgi:hypothetical protein